MFAKITEKNPAEYLGMGNENRTASENIENYVRYIYSQANNIERKASPWLSKEVKTLFGHATTLPVPDLGSKWAWNNDAHFYTYSFMKKRMRKSHQKLDFKAAGRLRMRQMQYWDKEFAAISIWEKKLMDMSEKLESFCRANGAEPEKGFNPAKAEKELREAFNKGDMYLYQLAEVCDRIFKFPKEAN
jgi:hypothetical protein